MCACACVCVCVIVVRDWVIAWRGGVPRRAWRWLWVSAHDAQPGLNPALHLHAHHLPQHLHPLSTDFPRS